MSAATAWHACRDIDANPVNSYAILEDGESTTTASTVRPRRTWTGGACFALLIVLTVGDSVLGAFLFDRFGETYAQYLNLSTALVYCVGSSVVLLLRRVRRGGGGGGSVAAGPGGGGGGGGCPWYVLVGIGVLNGSGNFLQSIGQPHTPGLTQSLLSVTGVPCVLVLSFEILSQRCSRVACGGALLIVAGACVSAARAPLNAGGGDEVISHDKDDDGGGIDVYWYSVVLYASAQVVFSVERVFEDRVFGDFLRSVDAMTMFCWTMWTQFFFYLPLLPTQRLGALGGLELAQIPEVEFDGLQCTLGRTAAAVAGLALPRCSAENAALFAAYVAVDGACYCFGLYCIRRFGANTMVLASAVALPVQQVVFCAKFLVGLKFAETLFGTDLAALVLVLAGFLVYHRLAPEASAERKGL